MNTSDDDYDDLHDQFVRAMGSEPVMRSLPQDDLVRGRRLLRRRRLAAVTATAVTVPAMAFGGWLVSVNLGSDSAPGAGVARLQPADSSSDNGISSTCVQVEAQGGGTRAAGSPPRRAQGHLDTRGGATSVHGRARVSSGKGSLGVAKAESGTECDAEPGDPSNLPEVDRVIRAVLDLDPDRIHTGGSLTNGGAVESGDGPSALYAGTDWVDDAREGAVAVSVEDAATAGPDSDCQDHAIADGPPVTCVEQTLADGTTVLVGHGDHDGAERVTVRYDRPDGTVVTATADEATDMWWSEGAGPAPLTGPPVTVQQLIGLVHAPELHL